ncbi:MAG: tetratricopeptide repeat protein [Bacteroidetes bacterium]|nr:tetratricopeptide repeat protein [Bacteroidota bacterium]
MKRIILALALLSIVLSVHAQRKVADSLRAKLSGKLDDSTRVQTMLDLSHIYYLSNPDSDIVIAQQAYALAEKYKLPAKQASALNGMAVGYATLGDYPKAIQMLYESLRISRSINDVLGTVRELNNLGDTYTREGDYRKALNGLLPAEKQWRQYIRDYKLHDRTSIRLEPILLVNIGEDYLNLNKIDSADYFLRRGAREGKKFDDLINNIDRDFGEIEIARGHTDKALQYLNDAERLSKAIDDEQMLSESYLSEAKLYHNNKRQDSAEFYAQKALDVAKAGGFEQDVLNAGRRLYSYYDEDHNLPQAYKYFRLATAAKDSLYSQDRVKQILNLDFEEKQRQQEIAAAQEQYRASVRMYALIAGLVVLLLLAIIFWRNSNQRRKANKVLQSQKEEIQNTLGELKTTQAQLVQSAKMASLGELTAGIAHEIQNPLNFVNNFSEVNTELIEEMQEEIGKGNYNEVKTIAEDLKINQQKISQHGKRADFIVKGMLEHSRASSGERQATNVNVLADEFLKLSYHGVRAKDKSFNSEVVTHFDDKLPKINIVQQDIGRVLINLFGNAFYAVNQKAKIAGGAYKPTVEVSTTQQNGSILISVKDNGTGIPENVREKIMQPFFTTKPTGEGTGLGLSLSYDIVVKGHGGNIDVKSAEGNGSEFTVTLPLN